MDPHDAMIRLLADRPIKQVKSRLRPKEGKPLLNLLKQGYLAVKPQYVGPDSLESQESAAIRARNERSAMLQWQELSKPEKEKLLKVLEQAGGDRDDLLTTIDLQLPPDQSPM